MPAAAACRKLHTCSIELHAIGTDCAARTGGEIAPRSLKLPHVQVKQPWQVVSKLFLGDTFVEVCQPWHSHAADLQYIVGDSRLSSLHKRSYMGRAIVHGKGLPAMHGRLTVCKMMLSNSKSMCM